MALFGSSRSTSKLLKLKNQADELYRKNRFDRAAQLYEKIVNENPLDNTSRERLINCYVRLNQKDKAIEVMLRLAEHYVRDGRPTLAFATLQRARKIDPNNPELLNRLVELYIRQNNIAEARTILLSLADGYRRQNRLTREHAVLERLLELTPDDLGVRARLAHVKAELGRREEALQEYLRVASALMESGNVDRAVQIVQQAQKYFPDHPDFERILIPAYLQAGEPERVVQCLEQKPSLTYEEKLWLAQAYERIQQPDRAFQMAVDALRDRPEQPTPYRLLIRIAPPDRVEDVQHWVLPYVRTLIEKQRDFDTALDLLEAFHDKFQVVPEWIDRVLELFQYDQRARVLHLLDRALEYYTERNQWKEAYRLVQQILQVDPDAYEYREKLANIERHVSSAPSPTPPPPPGPAPETPAPPPEPGTKIEDEQEVLEFINEQITSAEVYYRYGMVDQAIQDLNNLIRQYPYVPAVEKAYRKLYQILKTEARREEMLKVMLGYAEFLYFHHRMEDLQEWLQEIEEYFPDHPELRRLQERLVGIREEVPAATDLDMEGIIDLDIDITDQLQEVIIQEGEDERTAVKSEIEFYIQQGLLDDARRLLQESLRKWPDDIELHELVQQIENLAATAPPPAEETLEMPIESEAEAEKIERELEAARVLQVDSGTILEEPETAPAVEAGLEPPAAAAPPPPEPPAAETPAPSEEAPPQEPPTLSPDSIESLLNVLASSVPAAKPRKGARPGGSRLQEVLQELEEDLQESTGQRRVFEEMRKRAEEEILEDLLMEKESAQEPAPPAERASVQPPDLKELGLEFSDLTSDFEQELLRVETVREPRTEAEDESWVQTLTQFKQKVEQLIPEEDAATHYNLGLAYMQMDLLDEAITEFQKAARQREYALEANVQLAECFIRKGLPEAAIRTLQRILEMGNLSESTEQHVKYMLATLYEEVGELDQAYELYLQVYAVDPNYQDVAERLKQMEGHRSQKPS